MRWGPRSLRVRLLVGTLTWLILAVALAGWGLRHLFEQYVTEQFQAQLVMQLDHLSGAVDWDPKGQVSIAAMVADSRFAQPLSGLYWQVDVLGDTADRTVVRSRSLWDEALALPRTPGGYPSQGYRRLQLVGPDGQPLLAVARVVQLPEDGAPPLRLVVAGNPQLLAEPLQRFTHLLLTALALLVIGLAIAVILQLHLALSPLKLLRQRLAAVRRGDARQLVGDFPQELAPLVAEFNHVLAENADMVQRARKQAGNLAHAVHTPLAVLTNAAAQDASPLATLVREQVDMARRQVDYHLAQSRAAAAVRATGLATPVLPALQALIRTMTRLYQARGVTFEIADGAQDLAFCGEEQDLYELAGNLIDNAGKWARSRVVVDARDDGELMRLTVDDDGPGIPVEQRQRMFARGVQLDERHAGSGLGLDIVRTLAETYGGRIEVAASHLGGARFVLWLPRTGTQA